MDISFENRGSMSARGQRDALNSDDLLFLARCGILWGHPVDWSQTLKPDIAVKESLAMRYEDQQFLFACGILWHENRMIARRLLHPPTYAGRSK